MNHDHHRTPKRRTGRPGSSRLSAVESKLDANERRLRQVENALSYVAYRTGALSVGVPCDRCDRSLLIAENGMIVCPYCQYRRYL